MQPLLRARRGLQLLLAVVRGYLADDGFTWASATAFYLILSLPPLLVAASAVAIRVIGEERAGDLILDQVADLLPAERDLVAQVVHGTINGSGVAGVIAIPFLLLTGSRVFGTLILAIEGIWDISEKGRFLQRQGLRLLLLGATGLLLATSAGLDVVVSVIGGASRAETGVRSLLTSQAVPIVLVFCGLVALYRLVPPDSARWRAAIAGAVLGTVILRSAQFVFSVYVERYANFQTAYGPLASVAVLMTWALLASSAVLFGAELVVILERPTRRRELGRGKPGSAGNRGRVGEARDGMTGSPADSAPAEDAA